MQGRGHNKLRTTPTGPAYDLCTHDRARAQMTNYLSSVFKVLYQTSPDTRESIDVGPEELAAITASGLVDLYLKFRRLQSFCSSRR